LNIPSSANRAFTLLIAFCLIFTTASTLAQEAYITGIVLDSNQNPLQDVNISAGTSGTVTDSTGYYLLNITSDQKTTITFSHIGHKDVVIEDLILKSNETFVFNPTMNTNTVQIDGVEVSPTGDKTVEGITTISAEVAQNIPGANAGVENILKLLPGVSFNNELSTQYNVRGGNFDENLVYINGIEVYRPFLVRSAQQEGLSIVNADMVGDISFSAGGFQAKYGDKLSSVLAIEYINPIERSLKINASLLGGGVTLQTTSESRKWTSISSVRYRNNSLLVNRLETNTNFNPSFWDVQTFVTRRFSEKFKMNFLGVFSLNQYENEPLTRQTNFGTLNEPRALLVFYQGQEESRFQSVTGALKADYTLNDNTKLDFTASVYHTQEEEFSDVIASYELGEVDTNLGSDNFGGVINSRGIGSQQTRARNQLDALIFNAVHRGKYQKKKNTLEWGVKYSFEDFRDQLREAEFIDSAGFFIRPPNLDIVNNQPEEPFTGDIVPFESVRATNFVNTHRFSGFLQYTKRTELWGSNLNYTLGVRAQNWIVDGEGFGPENQTIFSPRAQLVLKPDWETDIVFHSAIGVYQQPPFYREFRNLQGQINPEVRAQRSIHYVLGSEMSFTLWDRPFTLSGETYYKDLRNVNPFTIEDVRIRYQAENNAKAYTAGIDLRLSGAFVPGTESWVSLGYLKTEENIDSRGYISRPTDQRLKFAMLFQDYMPSIPELKLYVNLVYNTGVPGGSPNNADPYDFQTRLPDYRRSDIGISYIFAERNKRFPKGHWLHPFKELSAGLELFNMFDNQNSITNTWVRDVDTQQQFAVPNFLTSRALNLRVEMRF